MNCWTLYISSLWYLSQDEADFLLLVRLEQSRVACFAAIFLRQTSVIIITRMKDRAAVATPLHSTTDHSFFSPVVARKGKSESERAPITDHVRIRKRKRERDREKQSTLLGQWREIRRIEEEREMDRFLYQRTLRSACGLNILRHPSKYALCL